MRSQKSEVRNQKFIIQNEKGIALVLVLVLSLIALVIVATLTYLVIQGTKTSGFLKRYETAREAALGGAEVAGALITNRGQLVITGLDIDPGAGTGFQFPCDCGDPEDNNDNRECADLSCTVLGPRTCLCDKFCSPPYTGVTYNWTVAGCSDTLDPTSNPDLQLAVSGTGTNYQISAKIVDTTLGNSDVSGELLGGSGVTSSSSGIISAPPMPYLYRIEIDSQDTGTSTPERSRLSVLYAY